MSWFKQGVDTLFKPFFSARFVQLLHNGALFEKMKKRNLKKQRVEYTSTKYENLVLDNELKAEVKIAASNGKVVAEGVNVENEKWKISTEETNLVIKTSYVADRTEENRGEDPAEKNLIEIAFDNHSEIIK